MLSALVSRTKALVGLNNNIQDTIDDSPNPNLLNTHLGNTSMASNKDESSEILQGNIFG